MFISAQHCSPCKTLSHSLLCVMIHAPLSPLLILRMYHVEGFTLRFTEYDGEIGFPQHDLVGAFDYCDPIVLSVRGDIKLG